MKILGKELQSEMVLAISIGIGSFASVMGNLSLQITSLKLITLCHAALAGATGGAFTVISLMLVDSILNDFFNTNLKQLIQERPLVAAGIIFTCYAVGITCSALLFGGADIGIGFASNAIGLAITGMIGFAGKKIYDHFQTQKV